MESKKDKIMICPFCGEPIKRGNTKHTKLCREKYIENLTEEQINQFKKDYLEDGMSLPQISRKYGLPYSVFQKMFPIIGIELRDIVKANNMPSRREQYEKTMLKNHGTTHNFNGGCELRKKWEDRLFEEEGIKNVFQRKEVKEKIRTTMYDKYGEDGIYYNKTKGGTLDYWVDKLGETEGIKRYNEICRSKGKSNYLEYYVELYGEELGVEKFKKKHEKRIQNKYSGLNNRCETILIDNNIDYKSEFSLYIKESNKFYYYDFIIDDELIIELNGIYWHCSPKKYKPNDLVHFPNNVYIRAKDKWESDFKKCEYAREHGYIVEVIWEDEFCEDKLLTIINNYRRWKL